MKTKTFNYLKVIALLLGLSVWTACSNNDVEEITIVQDEQPQTMKMNFQVSLIPFDAENATRTDADEWTWNDGATVYIQFYSGSNRVRGHAIYTKSTDSWDASFNGQISSADKCEVYYFENASTSDKKAVVLWESNAVYADKSATYRVENGKITLEAAMAPITSRIRFTGKSELSMTVNGITYYTGYNAESNTFTTSASAIDRTVNADGSTSYIYGVFADQTKRELVVSNSENDDAIFTKSFDASVFKIGESGYMTLPTEDTNKGWAVSFTPERLTFNVTDNGKTVSFDMIKVKSGTFQMGRGRNEDVATPVHNVKLTKSYYMGETEVTQALWYAVMGQSPTSDGSKWSSTYGQGDNNPAYYISYEDCQKFLTKLNQLTDQKFRFPTEAEWEFAAKGGTKSQGYSYAGGNTIGDVAWYTVNSHDKGSSSPDYGTHEVKTKKANELGLYDMSGNVYEWCADWYGSYSSADQTNPTGPITGSYRVYRGGSWFSEASYCRVAYRSDWTPSDRRYYLGFRLAL